MTDAELRVVIEMVARWNLEAAGQNRCPCGAIKSRYLALCLSCEARR